MSHANLNKNKKGLIEGNVIQNIDPKQLKGKIIIKRNINKE